LFINESGNLSSKWDFYLQKESPAIDAAEDVGVEKDFLDSIRLDNPDIFNTGSTGDYTIDFADIGAFEFLTGDLTPAGKTFSNRPHNRRGFSLYSTNAGYINVIFPEASRSVSVTVFDMRGRIIALKKATGVNRLTIALKQSKGTYFVRCRADSFTGTSVVTIN
jgi:hypothetical protein